MLFSPGQPQAPQGRENVFYLTSTHFHSAYMSCDVCLGDQASAPRDV